MLSHIWPARFANIHRVLFLGTEESSNGLLNFLWDLESIKRNSKKNKTVEVNSNYHQKHRYIYKLGLN